MEVNMRNHTYDAIDLFPIHHIRRLSFKTVVLGEVKQFFVFVYVVDEIDPIIFSNHTGLKLLRRWLGDFHDRETAEQGTVRKFD
jgi:hypothetical protein